MSFFEPRGNYFKVKIGNGMPQSSVKGAEMDMPQIGVPESKIEIPKLPGMPKIRMSDLENNKGCLGWLLGK